MNYEAIPNSTPIPDDDVDALLLVYGTFIHDVTLADFVERRLWLRALGEPVPRFDSIAQLREQKWSDDLTVLRRRGASRILAWQPVAIWSKGEPEPAGIEGVDVVHEMSDTPKDVLSVRLRLTNTGRVNVAAVDFTIEADIPASQRVNIAICPWRFFDPIVPGQSRDIVCRWSGDSSDLDVIKREIERPTAKKSSWPVLRDVSFEVQGHSIPNSFDNFIPALSDRDLMHLAAARREASCPELKRAAVSNTVWRVLLWLILPGALGMWLGRRL